jgi:NADPH:quinone reductase-like Zn-dependent oxidoreductase
VGIVHDAGKEVTRFKKGDKVLSITALALRNDHRYGAHQKYSLSSAATTSKVQVFLSLIYR